MTCPHASQIWGRLFPFSMGYDHTLSLKSHTGLSTTSGRSWSLPFRGCSLPMRSRSRHAAPASPMPRRAAVHRLDDGFHVQNAFGTWEMTSRLAQVFNEVAHRIVLSALDGINGTVFAYGQTGSGKTFTMTGGAQRYVDRGVIPRAIGLIYSELGKRSDCTYTVRPSRYDRELNCLRWTSGCRSDGAPSATFFCLACPCCMGSVY